MKRKLGTIAAIAGALAVAVGGIVNAAPGGGADASATQAKKPKRYAENELFIETNATDGDAGLQLSLDGEDWNRLKIIDPRGRTIMNTKATSRLENYGLTGLTFESSEPGFDEVPFKKFKQRFPEGKYKFRGETVEGRKLRGTDKFSHDVPKMPVITSPTAGSAVDPNGFKVTWEPVTSPSGIDIVRYIVIATQEDPTRELEMELGGSATSATIPGEFLDPGTETSIEVLAKAKNGNQTITEIPLVTN
jgi:hypothetical protein